MMAETMKSLSKLLLILTMVLIFTLACKKDNQNVHTIAYSASGDMWEVSLANNLTEKNGASFYHLTFIYKGAVNDLHEIAHITFAQGNALDTQVVNVFDISYKEKRIREGKYNEEEATRLGTLYLDLKKKNDKEFNIEYRASVVNNEEQNILKAIDTDRLFIIVQWKNPQGEHKEILTIIDRKKV
ncbi:hypothetical protein M3194_13090 [Paenibacillus glycanilyticus]|uniref:hypothetical protein n=1 Tax=Paenibacillus glycanilyticus TaxID=126569 RepID=UPI00204078AE|nr:hypothetical protein [Paenibacillus glycanilyticus]MCM3628301.1 hypothetical protein [Paenibacillus glycanilyticus]